MEGDEGPSPIFPTPQSLHSAHFDATAFFLGTLDRKRTTDMIVPRSTKERIWEAALLYGMIHEDIDTLRDGVDYLARTTACPDSALS